MKARKKKKKLHRQPPATVMTLPTKQSELKLAPSLSGKKLERYLEAEIVAEMRASEYEQELRALTKREKEKRPKQKTMLSGAVVELKLSARK